MSRRRAAPAAPPRRLPPPLAAEGLAALRAGRWSFPRVDDLGGAGGWRGNHRLYVRLAPDAPAAARRALAAPSGEVPPARAAEFRAWAEEMRDQFAREASPAGPFDPGVREARVSAPFEREARQFVRAGERSVRLTSSWGRPLLDVAPETLAFADAAAGGAERVVVATGRGGRYALLWKGGELVALVAPQSAEPFAAYPGEDRAGELYLPGEWAPDWPPLDPPPPPTGTPFAKPTERATAQQHALARKLVAYVDQTVAALGGLRGDDPEEAEWVVPTRAGPVRLTVHARPESSDPFSVYGRFDDVERAARFLRREEFNGFSGKWNLHTFSQPPWEVARQLRSALAPLAVAPAEREPPEVLAIPRFARWGVRPLATEPRTWQVYAPGSGDRRALDGAARDAATALAVARRLNDLDAAQTGVDRAVMAQERYDRAHDPTVPPKAR